MKKAWFEQVDVSEQQFLKYDRHVLETLLIDRTTGNNILWGTDDYCRSGNDVDYAHSSQIKIALSLQRMMVSLLASTQHLNKDKFKYVPLQNFNSNSPIDWTKDINEIDEQLFAYYGLSDSEQDFIKSTIKEM